jgi:beta-N-acetylhexosaminidase
MTRFGAASILIVAVGLVGVAVTFASGGDDRPTTSADRSAASALSITQLVGQRIVTGYVGTTPPLPVLRAVRAGRIGGVILFTNNMPTPAVAERAITRLQRWASEGGQPRLFVMIDQEGGIVQRLPQIAPTRSPASIGRSSNPAKTGMSQGLATGRALKRYGFNVNLAPVVDVPKAPSSFLGNRAYSSNAQVVADAGCAFAAGNEQGGTLATFKHFPGLGRAGADTDFSDVTINATAAQIESDWKAYAQCPKTPSFVMVSSARYPKLGIDRPASLEKHAYELLSGTGFDGLTITDALETPQFGGHLNTARSALRAGVNVLLYGQAFPGAMRARARLIADVKAGRLTRAQLEPGTDLILARKQSLVAK